MEEVEVKSLYTVKTTSFEGPLELLLNLVESRKLFINEISLASVTDDFLAYARNLPKNDLSELTSFLSIAATLILVKSRSLLPGFIVTKEEEKDIVDLETRLALYSMIRGVSEELGERYGKVVIHLPPERQLFTSVFAPDPNLSQQVLLQAVTDTLNRVPKVEVLPQVKVRKIISIDEMLTSLSERIATAVSVSFREWQKTVVVGDDEEATRKNYIVSFLAMLELVRSGMMDAFQGIEFSDIELSGISDEVRRNHVENGNTVEETTEVS
jgi:segregation and condensation protein A